MITVKVYTRGNDSRPHIYGTWKFDTTAEALAFMKGITVGSYDSCLIYGEIVEEN